MIVIFITRTDAENIKDLKDEDGLEDLITEANSSGIKDIFIISKIKNPKTEKLFGVAVQLIYDEHPTGPTSMNTLFNKLENKPDAFIVCSKEVGLRKRNIENLIKEIEQDKNLLVAGYKFMIKNRKLNDELQDFYENDNLIAYKVPWNTCAIWNFELFKDNVEKFDEITEFDSCNINVTIDGVSSLTPRHGMEDGLAIAKAASSNKDIKFRLINDYLLWDINDFKKHRQKLARKETVLRDFIERKEYSANEILKAEKKIKVIITLCPSDPKIIDNQYSYFDIEKDKKEDRQIYLGGDIRMQATVQIAPNVDWFIVVGGSKPKVDGMKSFLHQEFKGRKMKGNLPKIIRIESDPDTLGNMRAIFKSGLKISNDFAILTNFYHMPRAVKFCKLVFPNVNFNFLVAEAILKDLESTYSLFKKEFILRISREINGLTDIENGTYKDMYKEEAKWKYECHDEILLEELKKTLSTY